MGFELDWDAVDPATEFNDDTRLIYQALAERLGTTAALKAMAAIIEPLGGCRYQIVSPRPIQERQQKELAAQLLEEGLTPIEVMRRTELTLYQIKRIQREQSKTEPRRKAA